MAFDWSDPLAFEFRVQCNLKDGVLITIHCNWYSICNVEFGYFIQDIYYIYSLSLH